MSLSCSRPRSSSPSGVTASIAGKSVASSTSVSISPSTLSIDVNNKDAIAFSYEFTFNADKNDLTRVTVGGTNLRQGTDYNLFSDKNGIRIYKTYLSTLTAGTYTAELKFEDGTKAAIGIVVGNSAQSAVSPSQVTFDKYENSANYNDVTVTLSLPAGTPAQLGQTRQHGTGTRHGLQLQRLLGHGDAPS